MEVSRGGDLVSWAQVLKSVPASHLCPCQVGREFPVALGPDGRHLWVLGSQLVDQARPGDLITLFTGR